MLDKGYSQLPNVILFDDQLAANAKLLYCLISSLCASRGYCFASNKYLGEKLGLSVSQVSRLIGSLDKYIDISNGSNERRQISLRNFAKPATQKAQGSLRKNAEHNNTSGIIQVDKKTIEKVLDQKATFIASTMAQLVVANYSFAKVEPQKWAADIEKLNRIDGYPYDVIMAVVRWSQDDDFWKQNIRSGSKLRKQFETLLVRMKSQKQRVEVIS